jgi:anti-sigma B factor antagonist
LNIKVDERKPGVFVVSLSGDLDMSSSPEVRNILLPIFRKKAFHVIVDLSNVPYMDSSGIATFVEALQLARKGEVRFSLAGACRKVESVFDLAYLKDIFEMAPDVDQLIVGEAERK